jgi:hypothetical protein
VASRVSQIKGYNERGFASVLSAAENMLQRAAVLFLKINDSQTPPVAKEAFRREISSCVAAAEEMIAAVRAESGLCQMPDNRERLAELADLIDWRPIETMPFGERVMLYFEEGEKGNGEIDVNWVYPDDDAGPDGSWHYWTWGGPNSGSDFERDEKPVLWADPEPLVSSAVLARSQQREANPSSPSSPPR